ncbi:MAG TPA: response regulator [Trichormus sp. M33_DOE_039]|nr:response regulator [Trichormus sp. M33_DOE_039]
MEKVPIRVLLVDDNENDYILIHNWLSEFQVIDCELEWVAEFQAAQAAIAQAQHDIYLIDNRLETESGLELIRDAIANSCNAPMILLTGQGDREIDLQAMQVGAADYLEKGLLNAPLLERSIRYAIERKHTEQKIKQQAALLDIAKDAIFVQDLDGKILFWNQAAELLYGWEKAAAIGKKTQALWQETNLKLLTTALEDLKKNHYWEGELNQITRTGKHIIVESRWTLVPEFREQTESILVVNTEITHKKQLEAQFLRAQRLESIGTLASGIAHDLNNVLAPILMTAQLLETQIQDERSLRLLPILITNAKRGANLVKQVLSFTRGLEGERSLLQLKHLILEIKQIIKETFPKSIEIISKISPNIWAVSADATQIHQVLMNLCVNARDAMPNGGILQIAVDNFFIDENYTRMNLDAKVGPYVVITVTDTGIGIHPEILDRIFEPFFTTKEINKGTGLGLSTVLGIIKSHGGFINVTTQIGKGSQFKIYLPAQEAHETAEEGEIELPPGNGELILVVDDEDAIRDITKKSLENHNYKAITASDGIEAIALYAEYQAEIFLVLTDMIMPSMDGLTTIRTLQKINPEVKIIAVSGLATSDKVSAAHNIGIQAFLAKPYTANQLLQTINLVKNNT